MARSEERLSVKIQWFPGHMAKAKRNISQDLKNVELVIELVDARCPESSRNPDIDRMASQKKRLIVFTKSDLADQNVTRLFRQHYEEKGIGTIELDARSFRKKTLDQKISEIMEPYWERRKEKGISDRTVRAIVLGIPNVGKSTFINTYTGHASLKTGNKPGVTRGNTWINQGFVRLLDTPGITWPRFEREIVGLNLALIGSVNDEILNIDELVLYFIKYMVRYYPDSFKKRYGDDIFSLSMALDEDGSKEDGSKEDGSIEGICGESSPKEEHISLSALSVFDAIAKKRGSVTKGGRTDYTRTARIVLDDFRMGRLGRISLEHVQKKYGDSENLG